MCEAAKTVPGSHGYRLQVVAILVAPERPQSRRHICENSAEVSVSIRGSSTLGNGRIPLSKVKSVSVTDPHLS